MCVNDAKTGVTKTHMWMAGSLSTLERVFQGGHQCPRSRQRPPCPVLPLSSHPSFLLSTRDAVSGPAPHCPPSQEQAPPPFCVVLTGLAGRESSATHHVNFRV